eukprot:6208064-Pleurochrysis_carterae.AAC.1
MPRNAKNERVETGNTSQLIDRCPELVFEQAATGAGLAVVLVARICYYYVLGSKFATAYWLRSDPDEPRKNQV